MAATAAPANQSRTHLPTPDEAPQADIVIYDGHCRICTAQVRRLPFWDCQRHLSYLSLHDPEVARRFPDLSHDELMQNMYVIEAATGRRHAGADAIRYLSRRLRRLWWLAPILHIPGTMPLWRWCYRQVASRRYKLGRLDECNDGTCSLHD